MEELITQLERVLHDAREIKFDTDNEAKFKSSFYQVGRHADLILARVEGMIASLKASRPQGDS